MNKKRMTIVVLMFFIIGVLFIPLSGTKQNIDALSTNDTDQSVDLDTGAKYAKASTSVKKELTQEEKVEQIKEETAAKMEKQGYEIEEDGEYAGCAVVYSTDDGKTISAEEAAELGDSEDYYVTVLDSSYFINYVDDSIEKTTSYDVLKEEADNSSVSPLIEKKRAEDFSNLGNDHAFTILDGKLKGQKVIGVCYSKMGSECAISGMYPNPLGEPLSTCKAVGQEVADTYISYDTGRYLYVGLTKDDSEKVDGYFINKMEIYTYDPVTQLLIPSATEDEEMALEYLQSMIQFGGYPPEDIPYLNVDKLEELKDKVFAKIGVEAFPIGNGEVEDYVMPSYEEYAAYMGSVNSQGMYG